MKKIFLVIAVILLTGCSYKGTIVKKFFTPARPGTTVIYVVKVGGVKVPTSGIDAWSFEIKTDDPYAPCNRTINVDKVVYDSMYEGENVEIRPFFGQIVPNK